MAERKTAEMTENVIPLFGQADAAGEIDDLNLGRKLRAEAEAMVRPTTQAVDLSGRPKAIFVIGAGATGKTTLLKWMAGRAITNKRPLLLASVDAENRELKDYFQAGSVHEPPTYEPSEMVRWLESYLLFAAEKKATAAIDLGGGDQTLTRLVTETPDLVDVLEQAGISPVAFYMLSPRTTDLAVLGTLEDGGFRPTATALVRNAGRVRDGYSREQEFRWTVKQAPYRAAVSRGAIELWLPPIHGTAAREAENRRLRFEEAAAGKARDGSKAGPLGPFDRSRIQSWMRKMEQEFEAVSSWLP